ncbi:MAG: DNA primase [Halomonas sp.]|nr:DNA primase [Halomonas sp.]MCC5883380.1 DNA primase [Halomonas sp.]
MAGQIPQRFIDDLLARVDVVEVVGERVQLKKAGRNYSGLCPFHQEKTPSFTVSADKQFYHCFGCGAHGSALRFLMEYDNLRFPEAVEQLAARLGLEVPREGADDPRAQARERKRQEGVNLLELSSSFYRERLKMQEGSQAREYLSRRGLSEEVQRDFAIGYAPDDWEALKHHLSARGVPESVQVEYGLLVQREESGRTYDRFRDRVMFPIRDVRGRTIAFGGRVLGDAKPKYLNSPETPVFHKGRELYGLFEARQANSRLERLVIVEGYMDVVALAQFGIRNAVATLGTSTSEEHLARLFRMVDEVVFCFDGDKAGRQAASRALETVLPQMIDGRTARFLFLPEGEDPDTLVRREGAEAFEDRITCASPLSEFLFDQAARGRDLARVEERERFASQVLKAVARLPQGMLQTVLLAELARRTGVDQSRFEALMAVGETTTLSPAEPESAAVAAGDRSAAREVPQADRTSLGVMARVLQLLVHEPALVERLPAEQEWCPEGEGDAMLCGELVRLLRAGRYRSPRVVLAHFQGSAQGERLAVLARREMLIPREARGKELDGLIDYLRRHRQRKSPQEEFEALLAKERGGERLSLEARQRLQELLLELKR